MSGSPITTEIHYVQPHPRAGSPGQTTAGDHPPRRTGHRQRRPGLPVLREQPTRLLHIWYRRSCAEGLDGYAAARSGPRPAERHPHRGGRKDLLPAPSITTSPPRRSPCTSSPTTTSRSPHFGVWRISNGVNLKPAARLPAVHPPRQTVETLARSSCPATRSKSTSSSSTGRCRIRTAWWTEQLLQFTAIDDCTRLRVLRSYPQPNHKTAIGFVDYVGQRLPSRSR
jgi:hypothetical protein